MKLNKAAVCWIYSWLAFFLVSCSHVPSGDLGRAEPKPNGGKIYSWGMPGTPSFCCELKRDRLVFTRTLNEMERHRVVQLPPETCLSLGLTWKAVTTNTNSVQRDRNIVCGGNLLFEWREAGETTERKIKYFARLDQGTDFDLLLSEVNKYAPKGFAIW